MKNRSPIPKEIIDELMVKCGHRCCIDFAEFNITPLDIHHLDENPSKNDLDNLMPVCKNCHHGKIHNKASFARKYTVEELKIIRDDWYKRIEDQRGEISRIAAGEIELKLEAELSNQFSVKFEAFFEDSEILSSKTTNIVFKLDNNTPHKIFFQNYQFQIFYVFTNKLIHHVTFLKHTWNIIPHELEPFNSFQKKFQKVDPMKYYLMSDQKGSWIVRVNVEFQFDKSVIINNMYSDAMIKII